MKLSPGKARLSGGGRLFFAHFKPKATLIFLSPLALLFSAFGLQEKATFIVAVPAQVAWTDTGLEVQAGEVLVIRASGTISLQVGNPDGFCGPDGLDLKTPQQPLPEERLGSLIGKVALLLRTEIDPETKEVIRYEEVRLFLVGKESEISMPISGRLYLGPNENVVEDNSGEFLVAITRVTKK